MTEEEQSHTVLLCPVCRQKVRVPTGLGKLVVTCPKCRHRWEWRALSDEEHNAGILGRVRSGKMNGKDTEELRGRAESSGCDTRPGGLSQLFPQRGDKRKRQNIGDLTAPIFGCSFWFVLIIGA